MRMFLVCLLILFSIASAYSQNFPPVGAFWNYYMTSHNGGLNGNQTVVVTGDTFLNGMTQKIIVKRFQYTGIPPCTAESGEQFLGYMFQRNDSVFFGDQFNQYGYLFSFKMNVGDTLPHPFYAQQGIYYVADSNGNLLIAGDTLKKTYFTRYCNGSAEGMMTLAEDIGPIDDYLFLDYDGTCFFWAGCAESSHAFDCFSDGNISFPALSCNPLLTSIKDLSSIKEFSFFADLLNHKLSIHFEHPQSGSFLIADMNGRIIKSELTNETREDYHLDISTLTNGVYFLRFLDQKKKTAIQEKFIVLH